MAYIKPMWTGWEKEEHHDGAEHSQAEHSH
jgi:hypothetical protein